MISSHLFRWNTPLFAIGVSVLALTLAVLLVHGYHPGAEDGGIYAAGVYLRLHPALFPHDADFVRAPSAYSAFAAAMAGSSRLLRVSPDWVLLLAHLATVAVTLLAAQRVARMCGYRRDEQIGAMALLAAWWTLPVAGTSLTIGDPYVTARSFSMPFSLLAVSFAMEEWRKDRALRWRPVLACCCCLLLAAAMHRLMFGFAAVLVVFVRASGSVRWRLHVLVASVCCLLVAMLLFVFAKPEAAAFVHAELTRQYWFLSEWRWYEWFGLAAPLLLFTARIETERGQAARQLLRASFMAGMVAITIALLFAREDASKHLIARLQPLRMFMLLYAIMSVELGAILARGIRRVTPERRWQIAVQLLPCVVAAGCMYLVQLNSFPSSRHIEWPWSTAANPWVSAFEWCKENTEPDAYFAIDTAYIHQPENDAQTFRAHAWRSVLSDQSKDGGEAAVDPALASRWEQGFAAQANLNQLTDAERLRRLEPLGVTWMVLSSQARTAMSCPYNNAAVKVCRLRSEL